MKHNNHLSGAATLAPIAYGTPTPIVPKGSRIKPVTGFVSRDRLTGVRQDLAAVDQPNSVPRKENRAPLCRAEGGVSAQCQSSSTLPADRAR